MNRLFVLYDRDCALCRRLRNWLAQQPVYVRLVFIPLQSPDLSLRFPGVERFHPDEQLIVISAAGDLWRGESAWITVLWALREYREWSQRLAHPALRSLARRACALVSENRYGLSRWLQKASSTEIRGVLETVSDLPCGTPQPPQSEIVCHRR
jgi:predicted DCC family thiol-disulfide oxidoreductase YuxK